MQDLSTLMLSQMPSHCLVCGEEDIKGVCDTCQEKINQVDKSEKAFKNLSEQERQNLSDMSLAEYDKKINKPALFMTHEEWDLREIKREAETVGEGDCQLCKGKGRIIEARWNGEEFEKYTSRCKCVILKRAKQLMQQSGLTEKLKKHTFDNFIAKEQWQKEMKSKCIKWLHQSRGEWLFVGGQSGSGKTHLCTSIIAELLESGVPCRYMKWADEVQTLNAMVNDISYVSRINQYKHIEVLYIDDFFKTFKNDLPTSGELKRAKEIIDYRLDNGLKTIITTEHTIDDLKECDTAIAGRIFAECKDYQINLCGDNKNYRFGGKQ